MKKNSEKNLVDRIRAFQKAEKANKKCADCTEVGPTYVCLSFHTFVCTTCSGLHREFSHKVKGISVSKWSVEEVEDLERGGNARAADNWLARWDPRDFPEPDSSDQNRCRDFIRMKYIDRRWVSRDDRDDRSGRDRRDRDERDTRRDRDRDADYPRDRERDSGRDRDGGDRDRRGDKDSGRDRRDRDSGRDRDYEDSYDRGDRDRGTGRDRDSERDRDYGRDRDSRRDRDRDDRNDQRDNGRSRADRDRRRDYDDDEDDDDYWDRKRGNRDKDRGRRNAEDEDRRDAGRRDAGRRKDADDFFPDSNSKAKPAGNTAAGGNFFDFDSAPAPPVQPNTAQSGGDAWGAFASSAPAPAPAPAAGNLLDLDPCSFNAAPVQAPVVAANPIASPNLMSEVPAAGTPPQGGIVGGPATAAAAPPQPAQPQRNFNAFDELCDPPKVATTAPAPGQMPGAMPMMPGQMPQMPGGMPMLTPQQMQQMNPQQLAQMQMMMQAQMQMMMQAMMQPGNQQMPQQQMPGFPAGQLPTQPGVAPVQQVPMQQPAPFNDLITAFQQKNTISGAGPSAAMPQTMPQEFPVANVNAVGAPAPAPSPAPTSNTAAGNPFDMFG